MPSIADVAATFATASSATATCDRRFARIVIIADLRDEWVRSTVLGRFSWSQNGVTSIRALPW
jgi:hypothetical protein